MREGNTVRTNTRQQVKAFLDEGKKAKEIAQLLGTSKQNVSYHIRQIRLQANSKPKAKKRTRRIDWKMYEKQRIVRGECLIDLDILAQEASLLEEMNRGKRGRNFEYSDFLIQFSFSLRESFKICYATLEGALRKILPLLGLSAPDYSTICKRVEKLSEEIVTFTQNPQGSEDAIDSTGRSQNLRGSYRESKYSIESRKFVKLSVAIDTQSLEVKAFVVSEPETADIKHVPQLIEQASRLGEMKKLYADRGYDSAVLRAQLIEKNIEPVIRPRLFGDMGSNRKKLQETVKEFQGSATAAERKALLGKMHRLKAAIECAENYETWRDKNCYGKRATVENFFSRDTMIFGDRVCSKKMKKARVEMAIRISLLNAFITLRRCSSKAELESLKGYIMERLRDRARGTKRTPCMAT